MPAGDIGNNAVNIAEFPFGRIVRGLCVVSVVYRRIVNFFQNFLRCQRNVFCGGQCADFVDGSIDKVLFVLVFQNIKNALPVVSRSEGRNGISGKSLPKNLIFIFTGLS